MRPREIIREAMIRLKSQNKPICAPRVGAQTLGLTNLVQFCGGKNALTSSGTQNAWKTTQDKYSGRSQLLPCFRIPFTTFKSRALLRRKEYHYESLQSKDDFMSTGFTIKWNPLVTLKNRKTRLGCKGSFFLERWNQWDKSMAKDLH